MWVPFTPKGEGSPQSRAGQQPRRPASPPTQRLLVAEDFAVVEDLDLEHLIVVDAAGHRPPEDLRREGWLWPCVGMTGGVWGLGGIPGKLAPHMGPVLPRGKVHIWNLILFQPPSLVAWVLLPISLSEMG